MAKKPRDLQSKLKQADPEIRAYVAELERRNGQLQAQNVDRQNRIKALEKGKGLPDLGERLRRARERVAPAVPEDPSLLALAGDLLKKVKKNPA